MKDKISSNFDNPYSNSSLELVDRELYRVSC